MSDTFRELLKKIGSGPHTGENLTRSEASAAMEMMLRQEATPAQIGAFLIAHRIKRPTGEELAGMLDAYEQLGPKLMPPNSSPNSSLSSSLRSFQMPVVLGCPYDGRSRTAPIVPLTALMLASAGVPVILHGGPRMPTKEGVPLIDIWQGLGIDWSQLTLAQVQQVFAATGLGFVYLPHHFPMASDLIPYRSQIGKRPPLATMELIWCPYAGPAHLMVGYVHPPTEMMFRQALELRGTRHFTTIKGLEGSGDLPRDRTAIIGFSVEQGSINSLNLEAAEDAAAASLQIPFERLLLHPRDYGFGGKEVPLSATPELVTQIQTVLQDKPSELMLAAIWNGGFYLWRCGICPDLNSGLTQAEILLTHHQVAQKLQEVSRCVQSV